MPYTLPTLRSRGRDVVGSTNTANTAEEGQRGRGEREALRRFLFSPISHKLDEVEQSLIRSLHGSVPLVTEVCEYVLAGGGKRIRPALLLLAAQLCGYREGSRDVTLACVAEYMHVATLIHDDIIDDADLRRGRASANHRWGPHVSVLVGDFLYSRSLQMLVEDGDFRIIQAFSDATVHMTEGEIREMQMQKNPDVTYEEYLEMLTGKTAALISASCRAGALVANAQPSAVTAMTEFGLNLGIGFQLVDDALDFVAHEERLGKPVGSDLQAGRITFPVLHVLSVGEEEDRARLAMLAAETPLSPAALTEIRDLVRRYHALEATRERVRGYLDKATATLALFPDCPAQRSLLFMVDFVRDRDW